MRVQQGRTNNNSKRLMGQLNKAMDRSTDSVLHRVRPQGSERVNMHNRPPPKGPRGGVTQNSRVPPKTGIPTGPAKGPGFTRNQPIVPPAFSPQQQMQIFSLLSSMMTPQQQQVMMSGMPAPAINPAFRGGMPPQSQNHGKSL